MTITASNITWELDFGNGKKLTDAAVNLSGKAVVVKGQLERKAGVEIKERWIVHVASLESTAQ